MRRFTVLTTRHILVASLLSLFSFFGTTSSAGSGGSPAYYINPQPQSCPANYYQCTTINQPNYCCPYNQYCYQDVNNGPSCCANNVQCVNNGQNTVVAVVPVTQIVSTYYPTTTTTTYYPASSVYTTPQTITTYYTGGPSVTTVVAVAGNPVTSTVQTPRTTQAQVLSTCASTLTAQGGNLPAVQTQANGQLLCIVRAGSFGRRQLLNGRIGTYVAMGIGWLIVLLV